MPALGTYGAAAVRAWRPGRQLTVDYLLVGGGGGGGATVAASLGEGGGGGGGDYRPGTNFKLLPGAHPIVIGVGGPGGLDGLNNGTVGGDTTAFGLIAKGGGLGGSGGNGGNGGNGGSGGGAGNGVIGTGGAATGINGHSGHDSTDTGGSDGVGQGGGGGGAGGVGGLGTNSGGAGVANAISGAAVTYSAGGSPGNGGVKPPGTGGDANFANRGGGDAFAGTDGIVIISYPGAPKATGGTITTVGANTVHTFTANGVFTVL